MGDKIDAHLGKPERDIALLRFFENGNKEIHGCNMRLVDVEKGMDTMITGKELEKLRKAKGLSQLELAEELGVSRQTVSRWERGKAAPSAESLATLGRAYGVSVDELLCNEPQKNQEKMPAPDPIAPAIPKRWPVVVLCIGLACALLIGIISMMGIYSINQKLEPVDTVVPVEEIERKEVEPSSFVSGTLQPLQP